MPSHYTHGPDYLDQEKKKTKKKKKTSAVDKLKEKAKIEIEMHGKIQEHTAKTLDETAAEMDALQIKIAEIKDLPIQKVIKQTTNNAFKLFHRLR